MTQQAEGAVGDAREDVQVWIGRVSEGRTAEHVRFVEWLNSPEAHDVFKRRRINAYTLSEHAGVVSVVFKAPHTGDPRLIIDFLRYPGLWPEFWEFQRGGRVQDVAVPDDFDAHVKVDWRRDAAGA